MIYEALKSQLLILLKVPEGPPQAPLGSPGQLEIFRASPRYLLLKLLLHFGGMGLVLAFELLGLFIAPSPGSALALRFTSTLVLVITVFTALLRYFVIRLEYDVRYYLLTDRSLRIRQGCLVIDESTYTFANIQNLTVRQGPLQRLFDIADLELETAGGSRGGSQDSSGHAQHKARLEGIERASELRDRISLLVGQHRDTGLGDTDEARGNDLREPLADYGSELTAIKDELSAANERLRVHARRDAQMS
jgi:membrane protein YdbS with pleckstrin-like domain